MKYVLINPVVDSMYQRSDLDALLRKNEYQRVECQISWGPVVKEKYEKLVIERKETIMDVRCPVAAIKIENEFEEDGIHIPKIEPILLHCAREVSGRDELREFQKVITTPCKALADAGNQLNLNNTTFMAWNEFEATLGEQLIPIKLCASPIPPGFFADLDISSDSISGEEEIQTYFENKAWKGKKLVEMLFCQQGCHNGDGVTKYE